MLLTLLSPSLLDQNSPHCFGRRPKEVTSPIPLLRLLHIDQSHISFVNQHRRLQRLPRLFLRQLRLGQLAQFLVNQRQQLISSALITAFNGQQYFRNVAHP